MLCRDPQSTKRVQGIQSAFAAPGSCLPGQAHLLLFALCSHSALRAAGRNGSSHHCTLSLRRSPRLPQPGTPFPSALPAAFLSEAEPFPLVPTLSLALIAMTEIILFQLLVYLSIFLTSLRTL